MTMHQVRIHLNPQLNKLSQGIPIGLPNRVRCPQGNKNTYAAPLVEVLPEFEAFISAALMLHCIRKLQFVAAVHMRVSRKNRICIWVKVLALAPALHRHSRMCRRIQTPATERNLLIGWQLARDFMRFARLPW